MKKFFIPILLTALCLIFLTPFFNQGFFETDDGIWAVVRQASFHNELRLGQFPVRWSGSLNYGYGYPLFNFSYPGPYYIGEVFHLAGMNFQSSVKSVFVLATIISILGMYYFASELLKNKIAGLIAAIFFLADPYRIINLYNRGSLGETLAIAFFPLLCLMGLRLLTTGKTKYLIAGSIMLMFLLISHNVLAFLFIPFFIYWMLVEVFLRYVKFSTLFTTYLDQFRNLKISYTQGPERKTFTKHLNLIIVMIVTGAGLSSFFWLPAIAEINYTRISTTPLTTVEREFEKRSWVLLTPFEIKAENLEKIKYFNRNTEYLYIVALFSILCILIFYRNNYQLGSQRILLYAIPLIFGLFMTSPFSAPIWKNIPGLNIIDFPWRIWGILIFIRPIIVASLALIPVLRYIGVTLAILALILTFPQTQNLKISDHPDSYYATNQATTTSASEYLNRWTANPDTTSPDHPLLSLSDKEPINHTVVNNSSTHKQYTLTVPEETEVSAQVMYFPGWKAELDGKDHEISYKENNGKIKTTIPIGTHTLNLNFGNTDMRILANSISVTTLLLILLFIGLEYKKKQNKI